MNSPYSKLLISLILISAFLIKTLDNNFGKEKNYGAVDWDNFGYYLYLPATFIYNDIKLQNTDRIIKLQKKYNLSTSFYQAHKIQNGNSIIQYTSGIAIIYSPAFFVGHLWANLSSIYPTDGFSYPYQISILIESFLILFLGLFYLRKFSLLFFSERITTFTLIIIGFGTNFLQIASVNISSPHAILFTAYCIALFYTFKWHNNPRLKNIIIIASVTALMTLSRPNELLFAIIPIFWIGGVFKSLKEKFIFLINNPSQVLAAIIPFLIFGAVQPLYWKYTTGEWIFDTYINEDFKLLSPYLTEFLFSFKKGWLLYTPIMFFSLIGFIPFVRKNKKLAAPFLAFTLINIWILSSWDSWWYAGSFSQRSIVQSYPMFILPLGYFIQSIEKKLSLKTTFYPIIVLLILFNLFQTFQFHQDIIDSSRMTKEYYLATFFDTKPSEEKKRLLDPHRDINYIPEHEHENLNRFIIYKENFSAMNNSQDSLNGSKFKTEGSLILSKEKPSSKAFSFPYKKYCDTSYSYFFARIRYRSNYPAEENPFGIVAQAKDSKSGKIYKYIYRGVEHIDWFETYSWSSMDLLFIPPFLRNKSDSLFFFLQLSGDQPVEIDQFYVEILDPSSKPKVKQKEFFNDYHTIKYGNWSDAKKLAANKSYEYIDSTHPYSSTLKVAVEKLKKRTIDFEISGLALNKNENEVYAVLSIENKEGENIFYQSKRVDGQIEWNKQIFSFEIPNDISPKATLKSYLWSKSNPYLIRSTAIIYE